MFVRKYHINPDTLRYERVRLNRSQRVRFLVGFSMGLMVLAILMRIGFERSFPTPRQIIYHKQNNILRAEFKSLNAELQEVESQLAELRNRDDRFYRAILSLEPVPSSIRGAGTGGAKPGSLLKNFRDQGLFTDVSERMDKVSNVMDIQSHSLDRVYDKAVDKQHFLASKPSINPISPGDPTWLTSGYGFRIDPFTKRRTAHHGIDLAGPYGLDIHCSGEGTVTQAHVSRYGYGKEVVVDHGYGFTSRYAHLQDIHVKVGQKLKRGEVLGTLGNTGRSTGPHLHYEIRENGRPVNPMYFFYENLSVVEYTLLASKANVSAIPYASNAMSQK
jgi:murein DD-endopeptidase MepM/ murein hydrolase activator NlpD